MEESIAVPRKKDTIYSDCVSENVLVMNWILNIMEVSVVASFKYSDIKELWDAIGVAYAQKKKTLLKKESCRI